MREKNRFGFMVVIFCFVLLLLRLRHSFSKQRSRKNFPLPVFGSFFLLRVICNTPLSTEPLHLYFAAQ